MFKKKQKYRNIFMNITFHHEEKLIGKCGTATVKYPTDLNILQAVANELAIKFNANINLKDVLITSICYISEPFTK